MQVMTILEAAASTVREPVRVRLRGLGMFLGASEKQGEKYNLNSIVVPASSIQLVRCKKARRRVCTKGMINQRNAMVE